MKANEAIKTITLKDCSIPKLLRMYQDMLMIESSAGTSRMQLLRMACEDTPASVAQKSLSILTVKLKTFKLDHPGILVLVPESPTPPPVEKPPKT